MWLPLPQAAVVVADDFLYDGTSKALHVGGGFNGFQQYRGGQNGSAGQLGRPLESNRRRRHHDSRPSCRRSIRSTVCRNRCRRSMSPCTTGSSECRASCFGTSRWRARSRPRRRSYFGGRFKVDLDIGTDGGTVRAVLCSAAVSEPHLRRRPRYGQRRHCHSIRSAIGRRTLGSGLQENMVVARLGAGPEVMTPVPALPPERRQLAHDRRQV